MEHLDILLQDYKGKTLTERLKEQMTKHMLESKYKIFGFTPRFMESVLITIATTEKSPELKGVSTSPLIIGKNGKPTADLLLDNFGQMLAGIHASKSTFQFKDTIIVDEGSLTKVTRTVGGGTSGHWNDTANGASGMRVQIGADPTPVTRGDVKIGVPFSVGPQAGKIVPVGPGGWNSALGIIQQSSSIVTSTLGGQIEECGLFGAFNNTTAATTFMIAHDNVSPALIFIAGETVNIDYTFTL